MKKLEMGGRHGGTDTRDAGLQGTRVSDPVAPLPSWSSNVRAGSIARTGNHINKLLMAWFRTLGMRGGRRI